MSFSKFDMPGKVLGFSLVHHTCIYPEIPRTTARVSEEINTGSSEAFKQTTPQTRGSSDGQPCTHKFSENKLRQRAENNNVNSAASSIIKAAAAADGQGLEIRGFQRTRLQHNESAAASH